MPMDPIPDIASLSLAEIARLVEEAKLPPVEKWNPTHCGDSVLVTPVEKLDIAVEDAPFTAVEMKAEGSGRDAKLAFRLNTGDLVTAGPDHALRFVEDADGPRPYLVVRGGMEALVVRSVYYELAERAIADGATPPGLWSGGAFFALEPAAPDLAA
ncbi:DUF1285 domain-containing protein [Sphingomonas aurantiaca]|uniref:DUF1285 domain-containing protein n=1 Tax=Sphingomonas aurantiaca TaxID=185949 RepID=UPI002FE01E1D